VENKKKRGEEEVRRKRKKERRRKTKVTVTEKRRKKKRKRKGFKYVSSCTLSGPLQVGKLVGLLGGFGTPGPSLGERLRLSLPLVI